VAEVRAVLFDVDGTLIATRRLYVEALADALHPIVGRRLTETEIMAHQPKAERRFLSRLAGPRAPETLEVFYRAYEARHDEFFQGVYSGVLEVLAELRRRAVPMGLVTGKSERAWKITSPRAGLGSFPVVVLDDHVPAPKPDPSGVALAVDRLGFDPREVVYLGDSLTDLEAAAAAGVHSAAVLWSKKPEELAPFKADSRARGARILKTPPDLLRLLAS
jgi:pyrophosphatase PpaX